MGIQFRDTPKHPLARKPVGVLAGGWLPPVKWYVVRRANRGDIYLVGCVLCLMCGALTCGHSRGGDSNHVEPESTELKCIFRGWNGRGFGGGAGTWGHAAQAAVAR